MPRLASLTLMLLLAIAAPAAAVEQGSTVLVDRLPGALPAHDGIGHTYAAQQGAISFDGRFVVFSSSSDDLFDGDDDSVQNVYRRDRQTGTTELISRDAQGNPLNRGSSSPAISGDGSVVAFVTAAKLTSADDDYQSDVYVRDLDTGWLVLANRADGHNGAKGTDHSATPVLDYDGSVVAFVTGSRLEMADDDGSGHDVYRRDLATGQTDLVSRTTGTASSVHTAPASEPAIAGNGNSVAFSTSAPLDAAYDTNGATDVYVRGGTTTTLVSRPTGIATPAAAPGGHSPSISGDGQRVAFTTNASMSPDDYGEQADVYLRRFDTSETILASRRNGPGQTSGNQSSFSPALSANGKVVAFRSSATDLVGYLDAGSQLYARDLDTGATRLVSRTSGADGEPARAAQSYEQAQYPSIDGDGSVVTFESNAPNLAESAHAEPDHNAIYVRDGDTLETASRPTGPATEQFGGGVNHAGIGQNAMSGDGRYVVFDSQSDWLSPDDDNRHSNVFLRDVQTGEVRLLSRTASGDAADGASGGAAISRDGRKVAFSTSADNLVPAPDLGTHLVVLDLATHSFEVADVATDGSVGQNYSRSPVLDADGSRVAFVSESHLHPDHFGAAAQAYVRDLDANTTTLASRTQAGGIAGDDIDAIDMDDAGTRVAFGGLHLSAHPDAGSGHDVFVRDLATSETLFVSRPDDPQADAENYGKFLGSISGNGRYVAFSSANDNLAPGDEPGNVGDVLVRDLLENRTRLVSRATSGAKGNDNSYGGALSRDGRRITFTSLATNLAPEAPAAHAGQLFQRDLETGTTKLVSRATGDEGFAGNGQILGVPATSDDGECVAWNTKATNLLPDGFDSPELTHVYLRAVRGACPVPPTEEPAPDPDPDPAPDTKPAPATGPAPQPPAPADDVAPAGTPEEPRAPQAPTVPPVTPGQRDLAPVLDGLRLARRRVAPAGRARLSFRLSEAARVTVNVKRGRRAIATKLVAAKPGRNRLTLRAPRRPGRYVVTVVARDAAGQRSATRAVRLRVM